MLLPGGVWPAVKACNAVRDDYPVDHLEGTLVGDEVGRKDKWQRAKVFQEKGNADRGDQGGNTRCITQGFVGDAFDGEGQQGAGDHREQDNQ